MKGKGELKPRNSQAYIGSLIKVLLQFIVRCLGLGDVVSVPKALLKELYVHFMKIEEILATLEELMDKEGLERIKRGLEEYKKSRYCNELIKES